METLKGPNSYPERRSLLAQSRMRAGLVVLLVLGCVSGWALVGCIGLLFFSLLLFRRVYVHGRDGKGREGAGREGTGREGT